MIDVLPKLPEGMTRKDLVGVHIMAVVPNGCEGSDRDDFECPGVTNYNVWVDGGIRRGDSFVVWELDRDFFVNAHDSREHALAEARKYAWLIAARYQLEVEEY